MKKQYWTLSIMVGSQTYCPYYYTDKKEMLDIIADVTNGTKKWILIGGADWFRNSEIQHISYSENI